MVEGVRLLTLTGPAGVGKTRLALAAATELASVFPDGVVLADLARVRDPTLVLQTLSRALGVSPTGHAPLLERLRVALEDRAILLLLDNFEHVLPAANQLVDLLAVCSQIRMLVTSRVPLQLRWEHILRINPLPVPDVSTPLTLDELRQIPAVALFLDRARARRPGFALTEARAQLVTDLVVHLDGLPLALELAAARLDAVSLPVLVRLLRDRLQMLASSAPDAPERQRSLEAAITWSYDLLSPEEQRIFRHLGVFVGRVATSAVAAVLGAEITAELTLRGLASLAEKSLIMLAQGEEDEEVEDQHGLSVFHVLETLREYAREQLERAGEYEAAELTHAHYFVALAERADAFLRGSDQRAWFLRLEREHDNLRAALRWLLDQDETAEREAGLRLAAALGYFWWMRGYHTEGARWLEGALARAPFTGRGRLGRGSSAYYSAVLGGRAADHAWRARSGMRPPGRGALTCPAAARFCWSRTGADLSRAACGERRGRGASGPAATGVAARRSRGGRPVSYWHRAVLLRCGDVRARQSRRSGHALC